MRRPLIFWARRLLHWAWQALVVHGALAAPQLPPAPIRLGTAPARDHPERLCPEIPLSPTERRLERELRGYLL